jgi:hypothetical protein
MYSLGQKKKPCEKKEKGGIAAARLPFPLSLF